MFAQAHTKRGKLIWENSRAICSKTWPKVGYVSLLEYYHKRNEAHIGFSVQNAKRQPKVYQLLLPSYVFFFFYVQNIYYNICSKSKKSSSRELMLFTIHNRQRGDGTKKTYTHKKEINRNGWTRKQMINILKKHNISVKIIVRNSI